MFAIAYADGWDKHFARFDKGVKLRILKKIEQLKRKGSSRHLSRGLHQFVEEVGGHIGRFLSHVQVFCVLRP